MVFNFLSVAGRLLQKQQDEHRWLQSTIDGELELDPSPDIPAARMAVSAIPIVLVATLGVVLKLGNVRSLLVASARCVVQLLLLGLILTPIFGNNELYVVLPYVLFMILFATREASVKPKYQYRGMRLHMFVSIIISLTFFLALISFGVLQPEPFWDAQVIIPVGGMMLGSCVSALSLGMDRFLLSLSSGSTTQGSATLQTYLACGASRWEAALPSIRQAIETGLTPNSNQMSVMGLVSIPGMFTGQILAGTSPWVAAKYQIVIMFFVCSNSTFILFLTMVQAVFRQLFDRRPFHFHCFRGDLVTQRSGGKPKDIVLASVSKLEEFGAWVNSRWSKTVSQDHGTSNGIEIVSEDGKAISTNKNSPVELNAISDTTELGQATDSKASGPAAGNTIVQRPSVSPMAIEAHQPLLSLKEGRLSHGGRILLDRLHLNIYEREILVVAGASGTGKSTLLRALALLQPFEHGVLSFKGRPIAAKGANEWRSEVLYVRQAGGQGLSGSPKDVLGKLCELEAQSRRLRDDLSLVSDRFASNLEALALSKDMMDHRWDNMSGGEAQRVYMCMLLALQPAVLLLDEPTSACDEQNAKKVEELIVSSGIAVIWISHDPAQMERLQNLKQTSLLQVERIESARAVVGDGGSADIELRKGVYQDP